MNPHPASSSRISALRVSAEALVFVVGLTVPLDVRRPQRCFFDPNRTEATRRHRNGDLLIANQSRVVLLGCWRRIVGPRSHEFSVFSNHAGWGGCRKSAVYGTRWHMVLPCAAASR